MNDRLYVVAYESGGRMRPCPKSHKHRTLESAMKCVKRLNGLSIMEWIKDRRPQFRECWRRADLKEN